MKAQILALSTLVLTFAQFAHAMPCDTGWKCKTASGKYEINVQRCRYSNSVHNLESLKVNGKVVEKAEITNAYDSLSLGGQILAIEVQLPDMKSDARYLSFEYAGKKGRVSERVQESNPGPQKVIRAEAITCEEVE